MDAARQIIRFSIPGSILLLHAIGCYFISRRLQGVDFVEASEPLRENIGAFAAVLATIPIGFVVFQGYYFSYEPVVTILPGRRWGGRFVRADRGARILGSLEESQIKSLETIFDTDICTQEPYDKVPAPEGPWYQSPLQRAQHLLHMLQLDDEFEQIGDLKERREAYEGRWYANWDVLRAILDIAGSIPGAAQVKTEYTVLSDIYHSLGAARTAVMWGWGVVIFLALTHVGRLADRPFGTLASLAAITLLTAILYFMLHTARRRTWKSASASLRFGLRWLFWRHAQEFVSGDVRRESNRGRRVLRRALSGREIEKSAPALIDNRSIGENLQSLARRGVSGVEALIKESTSNPESAAEGEQTTPIPSSVPRLWRWSLLLGVVALTLALGGWLMLGLPLALCFLPLAFGLPAAVAISRWGGRR